MESTEWCVNPHDPPVRLDVALARRLGVSRSRAARLIASGTVRVNERPGTAGHVLRPGDRVSVSDIHEEHAIALAPSLRTAARDIQLDIVFEDAHILVINKPRGLVVHPAPGHADGTLTNLLTAMSDDLSEIGGDDRPGIVHRLDKDTTGLMVVAKNDAAHLNLQAQIQRHEVERMYRAIVWGSPGFPSATVRAAIGRHPRDRKRMAVLPNGTPGAREAITDIKVIGRYGPFAEIEARLQTGRTHQIRVHCAYIGHPVVGDPIYGGIRRLPSDRMDPAVRARIAAAIDNLGGQALHAGRLSFRHPVSDQHLTFEAAPPPDMEEALRVIRACFAQ